ncbi:hypothetical protein J7L01_00660 [bacterium]|nr:hypothetical protein [bacterium]
MIKKHIYIFFIILLAEAIMAQDVKLSGSFSPASIGLQTEWGDCQGEPSFEMGITISQDSLELMEGPCDGVIIGYKGFDFLGKVAAPRVPYVSYAMEELPEGMLPKGIRLIESEVYRLEGKFRVSPESHPIPLLDPNDENYIRIDPCSTDVEIYQSDKPFPGYVCSAKGGIGYKGAVGYLEFLPIQVQPKSGNVYFVRKVKVQVFTELSEPAPFRRRPRGGRAIPSTDATNIIICADSLTGIADSFKVFHESYGVETYVVAVESIDANYDTVPGPDTTIFPGWQQVEKPDCIIGYNWDRARKIVAYLRDSAIHPNLESITLLGDADVIPPSYYYFRPYEYDCWDYYPIDYLYMSYDYDEFVNIGVGRLPIHTNEQADLILTKEKRYYANLDEDIFKKTVLMGGDVFKSWAPVAQNERVGVKKELLSSGLNFCNEFYTDSSHNGKVLYDILESDSYGIISITDHGSSSSVHFQHWDGYWNTSPYQSYGRFDKDDIEALPVCNHPTMYLTGACNNGVYDDEICDEVYTDDGYAVHWIRSNKGGIAFWGNTRYGWGYGSAWIYNGYKVEILDGLTNRDLCYILKGFNFGGATIGEIDRDGRYQLVCDGSRTGGVLLGSFHDAGLYVPVVDTIPIRAIPPDVTLPGDYIEVSGSYCSSERKYLLEDTESLYIDYVAPGPVEIRISEADFLGVNCVVDTSYSSPYKFYPPYDQMRMYLARFINEDNIESWILFYAGRELLSVDGDKSDWDSLGLEPVAIDDSLDTENIKVELYDLYISEDDDYYYFGFHCWGEDSDDDDDYGYILAIDSETGGYSGTPGSTEDPDDNLIAFDEGKAPDYFLFFWKDNRYSLYKRPNAWFSDYQWNTYNGPYSPLEWRGGNLYADEQVPDAFAHGYRDGGSYPNYRWWMESRVGKEMIGNPERINVVLYSVYGENSHAPYADCVPSNPDSLIITEFATYGLMPITVEIDSAFKNYGFKFIADGVEYTDSSTFMWTTGTIHNIEFKISGNEWLGYKTQTDNIFNPYRYLGRFLKWSDGTTDYDSASIMITVPETPTTFICHLKDIQAGPEAMLPHGEFFDIHGEKKPMYIKE